MKGRWLMGKCSWGYERRWNQELRWRPGFRSFHNWEKREEAEVCRDAVKFMICCCYCCSVTKLRLTLQPHGPQHARLSCPSPYPGVCPSSCPWNQWCHPTISSSVVHFSCLQNFSASGSFQMSQLFTSGGQSIGVSASTSVLPMNTQDWSPLGWTSWISL